MNIREAKEQIKKTMKAYFSKDEKGDYYLSREKQRPVFLMGPPGIGKTAILHQVAEELGVGLVSYSITHHTRQSALGLPFIVERTFGGKKYQMTEYTMSEIVASVYREIEDHGHKEGILFLDEMNCVSETLAPVMLQFLQYKTFGMHAIPEGWLVVTAGNPPEYNSSAREFDPVTWDRLKRINVEPDLKAWTAYAADRQVHPAVRSYLELHPEHFYSMEHTVDGNNFVTARGWEDLSSMLRLYELNDIETDPELFGQYLQSREIAKNFGIYYDLYMKYRSDYQISGILNGTAKPAILDRAKEAPFDERITLTGMLSDAVRKALHQVMKEEEELLAVRDFLRKQKEAPEDPEVFARKKASYQERVVGLKAQTQQVQENLDHTLTFLAQAFGHGTEMLLVMSDLTEDKMSSRFLGRHGSDTYQKYSALMMVQDRRDQILNELLS